MKFAIYARQSKFKGTGESINNQITMCKNFIYLKFPDINESDFIIFQDENFSGKDTNRPEFQKMQQSIQKKLFDFVVCYKLDRVSRSVNDFSSFINTLDMKGIKFISVKDQFDTSTPMGKAMMNMTAVFAQMERDTIAERVRDNMILLSRTGQKLGGKAPMGFISEKVKVNTFGNKIKTACFLKETKDIEIVKIIFNKFLECGSYKAISRYLFSLGYSDKFNRPFVSSTLKHILSNPVYCTADKTSFDYFTSKGCEVYIDKKDFPKKLGLLSYNQSNQSGNFKRNDPSEWIISLGQHKGVIKSDDWIQVQNIMEKNKTHPRICDSNGLFGSMIVCKHCGAYMYAKTDYRNKHKRIFYYVCGTKVNVNSAFCKSKNLNGNQTDEKIINMLMNFDEKELRKRLHSRKFVQKVNKMKDEAEELHFQIIELQQKKDKYLKHLLKTEPRSPFALEIESTINKISSDIEHLKHQKVSFEIKSQNAINEKADVDYLIKNIFYFKEHFNNLKQDEKKSLLQLIIDKIIWDNENLKVILNGEELTNG